MIPKALEPSLDLLQEEYVLVQAWKKTAPYIRYHNWYSDTLALDRAMVNLPSFIKKIQERLQHPAEWKTEPLRLVPAPKSQRWVIDKSGKWQSEGEIPANKIRPLAHVDLKDQVIATALMLCLANKVETKQGDPRLPVKDIESRKKISSYGNRLFCDKDEIDGTLYHRWGSSKLYRSYFEDYRSFIYRPAKVAESIQKKQSEDIYIIEFDLSKFYDRVRSNNLVSAIEKMQDNGDNEEFFDFAKQILNFSWYPKDYEKLQAYSKQESIENFNQIVLPQGLVASGFFANMILLKFDEKVQSEIGNEIMPGIHLEDIFRYVDDIRIVIRTKSNYSKSVERAISKWLDTILNNETPGLVLAQDKIKVGKFGGSETPFVRQSIRMKRIQSAISGGFDAIAGTEILDSIQGLMRSQTALSTGGSVNSWRFSPVPDVRNETIARFSAARFRTTYRSIRPLLEDYSPKEVEPTKKGLRKICDLYSPATKQDIDEDARGFALDLIKRWIEDPSNVRLLRIGLDIWPDPRILESILELLRPEERRGNSRQVAWYCLAELLRAGATETGFVNDNECLPQEIDLAEYRNLLCIKAKQVIEFSNNNRKIPWYVQQQALLFLAVFNPRAAPITHEGSKNEMFHYRQLILFLKGNHDRLSNSDIATLATLSRRSFSDKNNSIRLIQSILSSDINTEIAIKDPAFALELSDVDGGFFENLPTYIRKDFLCADETDPNDDLSLANIVLANDFKDSFWLRNELSLLRFSFKFLMEVKNSSFKIITPGNVLLKLKNDTGIAKINNLQILNADPTSENSIYTPPDWCEPHQRWRFQLGFLLRFILCQHPDFTSLVSSNYDTHRSEAYRPAKSHWFQRRYGFFNALPAFGNDWLPITDWMEQFLSALLSWPGCHISNDFHWISSGIKRVLQEIEKRINILEEKSVIENVNGQNNPTRTLILPIKISPPVSMFYNRSLRGCVVQTIIPKDIDRCDLTCSDPNIRNKHRNHLSATLAAVKSMLALRRTHINDNDCLDWLILPELAVHPNDVEKHLVPFALTYKTLILVGLTYEELLPGQPLINSALWIIPEWSKNTGLQIRKRRQGKEHLAPNERDFNLRTDLVQGFRPAQWLIEYPWSDSENHKPLRLTASICYDATDLALATALRNESDIYAIPAFNQDVKTFDQMALALHYHMFQLIIIANNGKYGGSSAYWPLHKDHKKQIFHLHGQPQASIGFFEIKNIQEFLNRGENINPNRWKSPPAGWDK